ncbi:MAG: C40 family peptidase [Daejeonella sp.]
MNQQYGICNLSVIPVRAEPSHQSEMVTQLLFGEFFKIIETKDKWAKILIAHDEYEGWIDHKQFAFISDDTFKELTEFKNISGLAIDQQIIKKDTGEVLNLVAGSNFPLYSDHVCRINDVIYQLEKPPVQPKKSSFDLNIINSAKFYLNAPYLWGGRSVFGIDCSGFTQMVYRQFGIKLNRDAWQQALQGELVGFLQQARAGDLAFFDNEDGRITHVGIMLNNTQIIHASGRVKIDAIDDEGIYVDELKYYTHKLRIIKRFN